MAIPAVMKIVLVWAVLLTYAESASLTRNIQPPRQYHTPPLPFTNHTEPRPADKYTTVSGALSIPSPANATVTPGQQVNISSSPASYSTYSMSKNIFSSAIGSDKLPSQFAVRNDHPVPRKGIASKGPLQTNKFYSNFFLGNQLAPTFTFPYSVAWSGGKGVTSSWGMACSHIEANQRVYGDVKYNGAASYYLNPVGIQSLIISAKELGNGTSLKMDSLTAFSARVHLVADKASTPTISFPLVQGMASITAQFSGATPVIQSGVYFKTMTRVTRNPKEHVTKYTFTLEDGAVWRVYGWRTKGDELDLKVINNGMAESCKPFYGVLQVFKDACTPGAESWMDDAAGIFPVTLNLSGSVTGKSGKYSFNFQKDGHQTGSLYMYALPHHIESFDNETKSQVQKVQLQTTTKGLGTLVKGHTWTMVEGAMPIDMGFEPWHPVKGSVKKLSDLARSTIKAAAQKELTQNMVAQSDLDSMYFSGKALAKFASIIYVVDELLGEKKLAKTALGQLQAAFDRFASNNQKFPLVHETAWGGIVSTASYVTGNDGVDFGNTYYNDHHFHYGYHILAAAIIGHLDKDWAKKNKDYVDLLVRDITNPSEKDTISPQWRNFDWYHGHSWAHGLYAAMDGKDQESSSEDMMHAYALKMWGAVSDNKDLEARSNLQLSIIARSLQHYYLYDSNNTVQPERFIGNKVAGILFENKIDHTTYFNPSIEAIQGIHMIPILPPTAFVRKPKFVQEEWDAFFSKGRIDKINNAWKGIAYASYAVVDPKTTFKFFSSKDFDPIWLDGGASLTWFLAYSAAMGEL